MGFNRHLLIYRNPQFTRSTPRRNLRIRRQVTSARRQRGANQQNANLEADDSDSEGDQNGDNLNLNAGPIETQMHEGPVLSELEHIPDPVNVLER